MTIELANWFLSHQDLVAWTAGWCAALGAAQVMKLYLPPKTTPNDVKRILTSVAVGVGGLVAFMLWPTCDVRAIGFAVSAGLSAPAAYTLGRALIDWQFPVLAEKLSWRSIRYRHGYF